MRVILLALCLGTGGRSALRGVGIDSSEKAHPWEKSSLLKWRQGKSYYRDPVERREVWCRFTPKTRGGSPSRGAGVDRFRKKRVEHWGGLSGVEGRGGVRLSTWPPVGGGYEGK